MANSTQMRARLQVLAEELCEEFGPVEAPPGEVFAAVEAWADELADTLERALIERQLPPPPPDEQEACCPDCGRRALWKGNRPRQVQTARGAVDLHEPEYYCPKCRRSFFPGEPSLGLGS